MSKLMQQIVYRRPTEANGANRFDPTPGKGALPRAAQSTAEAAPQLPLSAAPVTPPALPAAPVKGHRIALSQGDKLLAGVDAVLARKTPESSINAGLYGKVVVVVGLPLTLQIGGNTYSGQWRQFAAKENGQGNWGWYFNVGKLYLSGEMCQCGGSVTAVNSYLTGQPAQGASVVCQLSINTTVIHSKPQ